MTDRTDNLLLRIRKYAARPENLLSEAFTNLLRQIARSHPAEASAIVQKITDRAIEIASDEWSRVVITTQISADTSNRPDIEIRGNDFVCWIEVKDGDEPKPKQLRAYHNVLEKRPEATKVLVSLTRSRLLPVELPLLKPAVGWSQVVVWLKSALPDDSTSKVDPVVRHLITEFLSFLGGIGMTVEKVGDELVSGIEQLRNMQSLIREALELECGIRPHSSASMETFSYFVPDSSGIMAFAAFLYLENPTGLGFHARNEFIPTEVDLKDGWDVPEPNFHRRELDLTSVQFFAGSAAKQTAIVRRFLRECLDLVGHKKGKRAVRV